MIPELYKPQIISTAAQFVQSITKAYGSDVGMELWNQIASVLDPSVKGDLFFEMVAGSIDQQLIIKPGSQAVSNANKIGLIKLIRQYSVTNPGLKEAKDIADKVIDRRQPATILVSHTMIREITTDLEYLGFSVG